MEFVAEWLGASLWHLFTHMLPDGFLTRDSA